MQFRIVIYPAFFKMVFYLVVAITSKSSTDPPEEEKEKPYDNQPPEPSPTWSEETSFCSHDATSLRNEHTLNSSLYHMSNYLEAT